MALNSADLSERVNYAAFVDRTLMHLGHGLALDGTDSKASIGQAVSAMATGTQADAATRVMCARFALGGDDASYLQSGLAVLWSSVSSAKDGADDLALAPDALYSPSTP